MDSHHLQARLAEIQYQIDKFKRIQTTSGSSYKKVLGMVNDPEMRSLLMENHVIHTERQKASIAKLERLYDHVQNLLASLEGESATLYLVIGGFAPKPPGFSEA